MMLPLLLVAALAGTDSTPAVRFIPSGDSVVVFVVRSPGDARGFVVYRGTAKVTPAPVIPAADGTAAAGLMGADYPAVARAVRAVDPEGVFRHLRSDPFSAIVLSSLYRGVARALGRVFVDGGVTPGSTYTYRVVFTDAAGKETAHAVTAVVLVRDHRPAAPRGLAVTTADHRVTLTWMYPHLATDSTANTIGFVVYRADGPAQPFHRVTPAPVIRNDAVTPTFVDQDAQNGTAYRYAVAALDLVQREGAQSQSVAATPEDRTPPAPVASVVVSPAEGVVNLTWRRSPEPDAAGYMVERGRKQDGPFARITTVPIPAARPEFVDTTVRGIAPYFYRIVARDQSGNESAPSNAVEALPVDHTPPVLPGLVRVEATGRRVIVRWRPSSSTDLQGYYVYRSDSGPGRVGAKLNGTPIRDTVFVDSSASVRPGHHYVMSVTAVDSAENESGKVSAAVAIRDDAPPPAVAGLMVEDRGGRYVDVRWSASEALDVAGYEVSRTALTGRTVADSAPRNLGHLTGAPPYQLRDTTAIRGRTYLYRVVTIDSAGNRSAAAVDTLRFTRPTLPPAPRHVAVRITVGAGVTVLWERVADPELAGYRVYRSTLPTGVRTLVGATGAGVTSLADLAGGPTFYYLVRAVDQSGNESAASPAVRGTP